MTTLFNLINQAMQHNTNTEILNENISIIATCLKLSNNVILEAVTNVLAGLSNASQYMNPNSIASFLAGVEQISTILANVQDINKQSKTLKVLQTAALQKDDNTNQILPNHSVVLISQYGAKFPLLVQKYSEIINKKDINLLNQTARKLLTPIEQAMNLTMKKTSQPNPKI